MTKPVLDFGTSRLHATARVPDRGNMRNEGPRLALMAALCLSGVIVECANPVRAQVNHDEISEADNCSDLDRSGAFEFRQDSHKIISKFMSQPDDSAGAEQIQRNMNYLQILGKIAAAAVNKASPRECVLVPEVGYVLLNLVFNLRPPADKCHLRLCANRLSRFLESNAANATDFSAAVHSISDAFRRSESVDLKFPMLSANRAATEAFRHIYPPGSKERIYFDLASKNYHDINFQDYASWFLEQQKQPARFAGEAMSRLSP